MKTKYNYDQDFVKEIVYNNGVVESETNFDDDDFSETEAMFFDDEAEFSQWEFEETQNDIINYICKSWFK